MVEQIITLGRVVIPSLNTPVKKVGSILIPSPRWRYKGPAITITLSYQVGRWGIGFDGDSPIVTEVFIQPLSEDWADFSPTAPLRGVALTGLKAATNDLYDMEMWFKAPGDFEDQGAIFTDCCQVPMVTPSMEIVSCSFI